MLACYRNKENNSSFMECGEAAFLESTGKSCHVPLLPVIALLSMTR